MTTDSELLLPSECPVTLEPGTKLKEVTRLGADGLAYGNVQHGWLIWGLVEPPVKGLKRLLETYAKQFIAKGWRIERSSKTAFLWAFKDDTMMTLSLDYSKKVDQTRLQILIRDYSDEPSSETEQGDQPLA